MTKNEDAKTEHKEVQEIIPGAVSPTVKGSVITMRGVSGKNITGSVVVVKKARPSGAEEASAAQEKEQTQPAVSAQTPDAATGPASHAAPQIKPKTVQEDAHAPADAREADKADVKPQPANIRDEAKEEAQPVLQAEGGLKHKAADVSSTHAASHTESKPSEAVPGVKTESAPASQTAGPAAAEPVKPKGEFKENRERHQGGYSSDRPGQQGGGGYAPRPAGGYSNDRPSGGGYAPRPAGGYSNDRPSGGGYAPRPAGGYSNDRPSGGGYAPRPSGGGYAPRPAGGGYAPRPAGGYSNDRPAGGGGYAPRPAGGGYVPRPAGGGYAPRPAGGGYAPRPAGGGYQGSKPVKDEPTETFREPAKNNFVSRDAYDKSKSNIEKKDTRSSNVKVVPVVKDKH
ncbi:MAG: DNA polymerase III subunit gamma/tau domain-containing protein, partial [Saccharofermentanales bacterium]